MVTNYQSESAKIGILHLSYNCALAFHNGWQDSNIDASVNTADGLSTSDERLVNFGRVIPEFCRRVYTGRAPLRALPRISSFISSSAFVCCLLSTTCC